MNRVLRRLRAVACGCACSALPVLAMAQSAGSPAIDAAVNANKAARGAQSQIDQLDDQTRALLERYRAAVWQAQQLRVYAEQVEPLLATQDAEKAALQSQAREAEGTAKDILPLMLRMVDSLSKFVALDLPFLQSERRDRVDSLNKLMADPATPLAEKYRRILEAYRIEADYGRGFGAERMELSLAGTKKVVDVLHVGRVALLYITPDGADTGYWDTDAKQWHSLGGSDRRSIREGLRIARETAAPEILALPVPAAKKAEAPERAARAEKFDTRSNSVFASLNAVERDALMLLHSSIDALIANAQAAPVAGAQGIDDLLKQIRDSAQASAQIDAEREQRFIKNKNEQQAQLAQAEGEQRAAQGKADSIRARYESGSKELAALKQQATGQAGDVAQIYAAVRETAVEYKSIANDSFLTAQYPQRLKLLDRLSAPDSTPSERDLEDFWFTLQQEMSENGRVAKFTAPVIGADGQPRNEQVTRIGAFTAFADGKYLLVQAGALLLPERQTQNTSLAKRFENSSGEWRDIVIDPTRGNLLALEAQRPRLIDRIAQGGIVGYVIIALGLVGVGLAAFQFWYLATIGARMNRQLRDINAPMLNNPLGRVLSALKSEGSERDPEVLETRLSEAVMREVPRIERFQPFLRMIVAAGPLLGLLGTVTGMIITFQVITEVGAGDPKVMAGGISQAMIATVLGLLIAIPILFINSILSARSRVLVQILDEQSAGMLARRLEAMDVR